MILPNVRPSSATSGTSSKSFGGHFDVEGRKKRLEEITVIESSPDFWTDNRKAAAIQKEKSVIHLVINTYKNVLEKFEEFEILMDYAEEDDASAREAIALRPIIEDRIHEAEQKALLSDEDDGRNAIVSINAGAGGTESCDWAHMLYRMIVRYCERMKFKVKTVDVQPGETAGIKSAALMVEGAFACGLLKSETGIHRLVRISPYDSNARRHTSFASVCVTPEVDDDVEIEVLDKDIRIDVYRSGGAGGQSVNTTDSAVRITHFPSKIVVTCQNERSQIQNRATAMKMLKSRLYEKAMEEKRAKQDAINSTKKKIEWGSQIRSYVLHPYKLVKDHRTRFVVSSAERVLDGEIEGFVNAFLQWYVMGEVFKSSEEEPDDDDL
jgi:peptide chain release factor 2